MTQKIQNLINQLDSLKATLDSLRPIKAEYNKIICQKFQLEFNYHSNHIEGNTLTLGETKNLILRGLEVSIAKKFRDIVEMKGHIDAYNTLGFLTDRVLTDDRLPLRLDQTFIKNLHKIIFVEDKITHIQENGVQSVTVIPAGDYKKHPNHVMTSTGAKFEYCEPWQVSQMMQDLLDWYNKNRDTTNSLILASVFHYKFIRIHPFGDGNGRTARLLLNLILQSSGQVIAMVKSDSESKNLYLNTLSLVDNNFVDIQDCITENDENLFEPFILEIGNCLINSYDIMIRGAKGESLLDVLDVIKIAENREKQVYINTFPNIRLTFYEVKNNSDKLSKLNNKLEIIQSTLNEYIEKVLRLKYREIFICERYATKSGKIGKSNNNLKIGKINLQHTNLKSNNKYISICDSNSTFSLNINIEFNDSDYQVIAINHNIKNNIKVNFYYIDLDFDDKLTQLIKAIDDYIVAQTKD